MLSYNPIFHSLSLKWFRCSHSIRLGHFHHLSAPDHPHLRTSIGLLGTLARRHRALFLHDAWTGKLWGHHRQEKALYYMLSVFCAIFFNLMCITSFPGFAHADARQAGLSWGILDAFPGTLQEVLRRTLPGAITGNPQEDLPEEMFLTREGVDQWWYGRQGGG